MCLKGNVTLGEVSVREFTATGADAKEDRDSTYVYAMIPLPTAVLALGEP